MELTLFPPLKKQEIEKQLKKSLEEVDVQTNQNIDNINRKAINSANKISQSTPNKISNNEIENKKSDAYGIIGLIGGAILGYIDSGFLGLIVLGIIGAFIGGIIGSAIGKSNEKTHNNMVENIAKQNQQKSQAYYDNAKKLVEEEKIKNKRAKKNLEQQWNKKYQEYKNNFETAVTQKAAQFAESPLVKRVVDLLTMEMIKVIDNADRNPANESIYVKFNFQVFIHQITSNAGSFGTYDFNQNRCQNLTSAVEQAAIARAIATQINVNLIMRYPQDISGPVPQIKIEHFYTDDTAFTEIEYKSANGYYKAAQKW